MEAASPAAITMDDVSGKVIPPKGWSLPPSQRARGTEH